MLNSNYCNFENFIYFAAAFVEKLNRTKWIVQK
jgi:hypothetical protein